MFARNIHYIVLFLCSWSSLKLCEEHIKQTSNTNKTSITNHTSSTNQTETWCRFLNDVYRLLSEYKFQKNYDIYNVNDLNDWGKAKKPQGINIDKSNFQTFLKIMKRYDVKYTNNANPSNNANITITQFEDLNNVLEVTLKLKPQIFCDGETKLVAKRNLLKISDVLSTKCEQAKLVEIFASDTIFIDKDIDYKGKNLLLSIIASKWDVIGNRVISLDGIDGPDHEEPAAEDALLPGGKGENGKPGKPGIPSGSFLGIAKTFINGKNLKITANGASGGSGQDGGNGKDGEDGRDADVYSERYKCTRENRYWTCLGEDGFPGGNGGKGGEGGEPGLNGRIWIYNLQKDSFVEEPNVIRISRNGKSGRNGTAGNPGRGGKNGDTEGATHILFYYPKKVTHVSKRAKNGIKPPEKNRLGKENAVQQTSLDNAAVLKIINDYKYYLEDCLSYNYTRKRDYDFLMNLFKNEGLNKRYSTLEMINQYLGVEEHFFHLRDKVDLLSIYNEIQKQIEIKGKELTKDVEEGKKVLSHLYATVQSKICTYRDTGSGKFIANIDKFLNMFMQNVKTLREHEEEAAIAKENREYKQEIDKKIQEAEKLVSKDVMPKIHRMTAQIEKHIDEIMFEITKLKQKFNDKQAELEKQQRDLERALAMGIFASVLKFVGSVVQYLPVVGTAISAACSVATQAIEIFVDQPKPSELIKLPGEMVDTLDKVNDLRKNVSEQKTDRVSDLEKVQQETLSEIDDSSDLSKMAYNAYTNSTQFSISSSTELSKFQNGTKNSTNIVKKVVNNIKKGATKGVKKINKKVKHIGKLMKKELKQKVKNFSMKKVKNIVKGVTNTANIVFEAAEKIKQTKNQIEITKNALDGLGEKKTQLETFEKNVQNSLFPMVTKLQNTMFALQADLEGKSWSALESRRLSLKQDLNDLKRVMLVYTKGMPVGDKIQNSIDDILSAVNTVIDIFQKIQNYQGEKKLADYISNINSVRYRGIAVKDPEVKAALSSLKLSMHSNMILLDYTHSMNQLKQFVFPLAKTYYQKFSLPSFLEKKDSNTKDFLYNAIKEIETYKKKVIESNVYVTQFDKLRHRLKFYSDFVSSAPFFVWRNKKYDDSISRLLAGEEVVFRADLSHHSMSAVKFNYINLRLKVQNQQIQKKLDQILKKFMVYMTHMGDSYYNCNNKTYVIITESQPLQFSFEKYNGQPVDTNMVFYKLSRGDFMLSPFATWRIQLVNTSVLNYDILKKFRHSVDLELVGLGEYFDNDDELCNQDLEQYYDLHDVTQEVEPVKTSHCEIIVTTAP